jgi:NAD(P)-dependent dehydrogenase (short-subunit alcohol dehydrogenase family)
LGLEFAQQYLQRGEQVVATCRHPNSATELQDLHRQHQDRSLILPLEVTSRASRIEAHEKVRQAHGQLDILINNAGIRSGGDQDTYDLGALHTEDIAKVFDVNATSPLLMAEGFLDLLEQGQNSKIINITSRLGSIGSKNWVYRYSYCASKAALNMISKMLSLDLHSKGISVMALHPGHVRTDLGGPHAPLSTAESVAGMIKVIDALTLDDTGRFLDWQGTEIPW